MSDSGAEEAEVQGIDSHRLASLIDDIVEQRLGVHSLTIWRHGHTVLDVTFFPYDGRRRHDFASCTKALTTTALGLARRDGAVEGLDMPLLSYFPDRTVDNDSTDKRAITLENAASMTTGFDCIDAPTELTLLQMQSAPDWVDFALGVKMADAPGKAWRYCGTATHLLSGVVSRVTGQAEDDYLADRLFAPIGAARPEWPRDPQGVTHGWGDARLWPRDMLRVGELFLHRGSFGKQRILDPEFVALATSNRVGSLGPPNGYGYGWWTTNGDAFYANGRGGQFVLVAPVRDAILVTTGAQSPDQTQSLVNLLNTLEMTLSASALPANPAAVRALSASVDSAGKPPAAEGVQAPPSIAATVSGQRYTLMANQFGWDSLKVAFAEREATLEIAMGAAKTQAAIGLDSVPRITRGAQFGTGQRYADIDVAMAGRWLDDETFEITFDTIDTIDAGTLSLVFSGSSVHVSVFEKTFLMTNVEFDGTLSP